MLGDFIKEKCKEQGITVSKLEQELDLSNGIIMKWNGSVPAANSLAKVAKRLDVSLMELCSMIPEKERK